MVSDPPGLLTLRVKSCALRTILRVIGVLVLAIVLCGSSAFAATPTRTILVFGDSLSAGYGLGDAAAWPQLLQRKLQESGYGAAVVNASVSGETTSGGIARLPRALQQHRPQLVILELGANDGLRGLPLTTVRDNLQAMIKLTQQAGAKVLLLGIQLPPNYGPAYNTRFTEMFTQLAATQRVALVPMLMEGVALQDRYMQADGLHPNASGQPLLLANVWPRLQPLLTR